MNFKSMDFFLSLMITFFVISILSQIMMGVLYQHMIDETENMTDTSNKLLKQFKQKFINTYTMNDGVTNVSVFVDRFLGRIQLGKLSLGAIRNLSGQSMLLSILSAGIGICRELLHGVSFFRMIPFYIITFIGLYFYFSVISLVDIPARRNLLRTNLIDYLENHMLIRLENGRAFEELERAGAEEPGRTPEITHPIETPELPLTLPLIPAPAPAEITASQPTLDWTVPEPDFSASGKPEQPGEVQKEAGAAGFSKEQEAELARMLRDFFV